MWYFSWVLRSRLGLLFRDSQRDVAELDPNYTASVSGQPQNNQGSIDQNLMRGRDGLASIAATKSNGRQRDAAAAGAGAAATLPGLITPHPTHSTGSLPCTGRSKARGTSATRSGK